MATHKVRFSVPERQLGKADLKFKVIRNNETFGTLKISNGSIVWVQKNKGYGHSVGWVKFDELMVGNGQNEKR